MTLGRYVSYWATMQGDRLALAHDDIRLTWTQTSEKAHAFAAALQFIGVKKGDRVGVLLDNSIDWCLAYYGALVAGAIFVPLNPKFGPFELEQISADADCTVIVSTASKVGLLGGQWKRYGGSGDTITLYPASNVRAEPMPLDIAYKCCTTLEPVHVDINDIAAIGYTSGTTGVPKGVMLSHRAIITSLLSQARACGWNGQDNFLVLSTLAFTGGYLVSLSPALVLGGSAFVEYEPNVERALSLIVNEGVSVIQLVPTLLARMSELPGFADADLSRVKAITGGAPVPTSLLQVYHAKGVVIRQGYACTESSGTACTPFDALALARPETCGPALPSIEVMTADEAGQACAPGVVGEIWIRGAQILDGYWRNPKATEESFSNGWFKTGDMGRLDENGFLEVMDRKKNMLISGGVNIYPAEIERAMAALLPEEELAVFGVHDREWGERAVAMLYTTRTIDLEKLRRDCREMLGAFKTPREFVIASEPLPRTATGKIARKALPEFYERFARSSTSAVA